jgi:hypothetical protein
MSTLVPERLEEWDSARAQGAFFVEQTVVKTLIESGKSGDTPFPVSPEDLPTGIHTPRATPYPGGRVATPAPTPRTPMPGAVPIFVPQPGTLVSSSGGPVVIPHHVGDVTEHIRVSEHAMLRPRQRKPWLVLALALGGAAATAITYLVLASDDSADLVARPEPAPVKPIAAPVEPAPPEIEIEPDPPKPAVKAEEIKVEDKPDDPPEPAPAVKTEPPEPAPQAKTVAKKPPPKAVAKKPVVKKPAKTTPTKKEPTWNEGDSPFLPVRPGTK